MHIDNILPADGINDAELVMAGGKKLVESVAWMILAPAAGNVESKKSPWLEQRPFKRVSSDLGDGKCTG